MYKDGERKMSWISKIDRVEKHPDADFLDICTIGGWQCITKNGEFEQGDVVIYISIDSWIPHYIAPFLSKGKEPREYNGIKGERLKTIKLRGQLSQGLILPFSLIREISDIIPNIGDDVSEILNITKWERPMPACLYGQAKGYFPPFIRKTDQERIQNLDLNDLFRDFSVAWEVTEKLDGSSMTVYFNDGVFGVCSRNLELKLEGNENNAFIQAAIKYDLENKLRNYGRNIALQGELIGGNIQGNPYKLTEYQYRVYDVYDIDNQKYLSTFNRYEILKIINFNDVNHVPIIGLPNVFRNIPTMEYLLKYAEGKSILHFETEREGLVFKRYDDGNISFKIISNKFLLKGGD